MVMITDETHSTVLTIFVITDDLYWRVVLFTFRDFFIHLKLIIIWDDGLI